jgi:hypothetical protein
MLRRVLAALLLAPGGVVAPSPAAASAIHAVQQSVLHSSAVQQNSGLPMQTQLWFNRTSSVVSSDP